MKKWLAFIALFLAFQAAGHWLSQPNIRPRRVTEESSQPASEASAGEPSIDELISKCVKYMNQRDLDQYLELLHPDDQTALEDIEQKFSGWKKSNDVIIDYSFAHAPISDFRLHLFTDSFSLTTLPTHAVRLRCQSSRGPGSMNLIVAEQNGRWYLVQPTQRKRPSEVDSSKEEFIYHFEAIEDKQHNWELAFPSSNSNDFQLGPV